MKFLLSHLVVVPIILPLFSAALLLLLGELRLGDKRRPLRPVVNVASTLLGVLVALLLLERVAGGEQSQIAVYLAANWEVPFGIVLVADRLSALMLLLVGVLSFCVALYAEAGWARAGVYFHPLFQVQLMGLNGAFLTGDLFNLFVFFEVTLAASYGLQLHGSGWPRVRSGLHYITVNLLASALFLIGLAVIYGVTGTLSMADVAAKLAEVPARDRGLLHAGAAIVGVAFLIKSAVWPLNFWLMPAYAASAAPVAALFAIMTKVGVYALFRLWTLLFSSPTGPSAHFGDSVLLYGGLATLAFGVLGVTASLRLNRIAAYSTIVSSGTLIAALGLGTPRMTSAALFYLLSATLAVGSLFLLSDLVERLRSDGHTSLRDVEFALGEDTNLDDEELPLVGRAFPISLALLGLAFVACTLLVAGLPPLSGFLAKLALLSALLGDEPSPQAMAGRFCFFGLLLLSGLSAVISLSKVGIRHFWSARDLSIPHLKWVEGGALLVIIGSCVALTVGAERAVTYTNATAAELFTPTAYIDAVLSAKARPGVIQTLTPEASP